eukprot:162089_1
MSNNILYVVGGNVFGILPEKHIIRQLTEWNKFNPQITLTNIYIGYRHTIFVHNSNNYYAVGAASEGECALGYRDVKVKECKQIEYFANKNISIQSICTNIGYNCNTFWITTEQKTYANGTNNYYQLGFDHNNDILKPQLITQLRNVIHVSGGKDHNIARCLSLNTNQIMIIITYWLQLHTTKDIYIPMEILTMITNYHSHKHSIFSVGVCDYGQGGYPLNYGHTTAWTVIDSFTTDIIDVSCGMYHSLFLDKNGVVWSCGDNDSGQLGFGHNKTDPSCPPTQIQFFIDNKIVIKQISCGRAHNLCIDYNGKCYGECGNLSIFRQNVHEPNMIMENVVTVKCGYRHSYIKTYDEKHYLFGNNKRNQCTLTDTILRANISKIIYAPFCINDTFAQLSSGEKIK